MTSSGAATTDYGTNGIKVYSNYLYYNGAFYAKSSASVAMTLGHEEREGYIYSNTYSASDGTFSGSGSAYTLTMPDEDVIVSIARYDLHSLGYTDTYHPDGTTNPYVISDVDGWNVFCDLLADNTYNRFSGKTVRLGDNITVTRMAGSGANPFCGNFDGGGNTLTFTATAAADYCAPFVGVKGGTTADDATTISNLNVVTTITANDYRHMAGLIALQWGHVNVSGCNATVNISSTVGTSNPTNLYPAALVSQASSSDGGTLTVTGCTASGTISTDGKYAAGLVGIVQGTASISDCISSVTINSSTSGDGTHGGIVAVVTGSGSITGCVFNGKLLSKNTGNDATTNCAGFVAWGNGTISNCLYAPDNIDTEHGETEVLTGDVNNYPSGTFYRGTAPTVSNCYYTRTLGTAQGKAPHTVTAGDNVTISGISPVGSPVEDGTYNVSGITAYAKGITRTVGDVTTFYYGQGDALSLTLGNTAAGAPAGYRYDTYTASAGTLAADGTLTMPDADVTITVNTAALASTGQPVAVPYVDADGTAGEASAIALDGTETSLAAGTYFAGLPTVQFDHTLTLTGNVTLILCDGCEMNVGESGSEVDGYGIICYDKANNTYYDLTICGQTAQTGTLSVYTTGPNNYAIGTHHITVNGGNVIAHTDGDGSSCGIDTKRSGNVTINSGSVSATTTSTDIFAWAIKAAGNLTINGGNVSAKSNSHAILADGNVAINGGTVNATGGDDDYSGIYSNGTIEINGGNVTASRIFSNGSAITLGWTDYTDRITASSISSYYGTVKVASGKMLHNGTDYLSGTLGDPAAVNGKTLRPAANTTYTTADGNTATADAILLDASDTSLPAGNYLATGTLNYTHGITLTGNVTLILADNCHMNVGTSGGRIEGNGIAHSGNVALTITSQSLGDDMGALGVYTTGNLNHGICGMTLTINGGNVTADTDGYSSFALWTQNGDLTINGGTVSATTTGTTADAICAYVGNFNYNGGNVTATAANADAIRAIGNYTFSWRTPADRITIGATGLYATAVKTATFTRLFTDATGNYYSATLTGTALNALKGVTLEAAETADFTVTLAPKGYGTYYDGHYDITLPAGTQARIVTARGGTDGTLDYETIADGDDGITLPKTVPAGTAVMLCHDGGGNITLTVNDADIDDRDFTKASGNTPGLVSLLHGSDVATETTGGILYYKLTYGSAAGHEDIFGWYWGAANGAAFESPAHKAWLALPAAEARSFIGLPDFDEQTGITTTNYTNDTNSAGAWYTLDGRKLDGTPMKSGIYVNNGKKVIIK